MRKLVVFLSVFSISFASAELVDYLGDVLRNVTDIAKGNVEKRYLCVKGNLSEHIGKDHATMMKIFDKIPGRATARIKHPLTKKVIIDNVYLGKISAKTIKSGKAAAEACIKDDDMKEWLKTGDTVSIIRTRDQRGIARTKVSFVGQLVDNKKGGWDIKTIKKG